MNNTNQRNSETPTVKAFKLSDLLARLTPPSRTTKYAYEMGIDCAVNGANETNCHFSIFSSPENTKAWEKGKRDAKHERIKDEQKTDGVPVDTVVSGSALLSKARQMRLEQQLKIDSYTEHYNDYEIGTLNGIDRIVKLIERHYC